MLTFHVEFIVDQLTDLGPVTKVDLSEKHVIVTGANVGLGLEGEVLVASLTYAYDKRSSNPDSLAARHFASMNPAKLILACRSQERGDVAMRGHKTAIIQLMLLMSTNLKTSRRQQDARL